METRYSFGGDDHIFVEVDEEMSLDAFFKSLSMTNAVRESRINGVTEICPANASFQIRFDPRPYQPQRHACRAQAPRVGGGKERPYAVKPHPRGSGLLQTIPGRTKR